MKHANASKFGQNTRNSTISPIVLDRLPRSIRKAEKIWFGDSALEIVEKRETEGLTSPLFFECVGFKTYFGKVGRR